MGKLKKLYKNWPMHNIVGHPLMEILSWLGEHRLSKAVHDGTLPEKSKVFKHREEPLDYVQ